MNRSERRKKQNSGLDRNTAVKQHKHRVAFFRKKVMEVMRGIHAGEVDEVEVEKLHNFIQLSLSLMSLVEPHMIDEAQKHAEILDLASPDDPDNDVIWDPAKLASTTQPVNNGCAETHAQFPETKDTQ